MGTNLNTLVSQMIAKPTTKSGEVLYARVDGMMETGNASNNPKPASQAYQLGIKTKYNSPDNLRRLFITHKGVYTQYHHTIVGAKNTKLLREYPFKTTDIPDIAFRQQVASQGVSKNLTSEGLRELARRKNVKEFSFMQGFGLRALFKPWVYNNVEEIYFDWLVLTGCSSQGGPDISQFGDITDCNQMPNIITKLLCGACNVRTLEEVLAKYPRLHTVGFIFDLENLFQTNKHLMVNEPTDVTTRQQSWIQRAVPQWDVSQKPNKALVSPQATILQLQMPSTWFPKYTLKEGIYLYDAEVLSKHFTKLAAQVKPGATTKEANTTLTSEETQLQSVLEKLRSVYGLKSAQALLTVYLVHNPNSKDSLLKVLQSKEDFKDLNEFMIRFLRGDKL